MTASATARTLRRAALLCSAMIAMPAMARTLAGSVADATGMRTLRAPKSASLAEPRDGWTAKAGVKVTL